MPDKITKFIRRLEKKLRDRVLRELRDLESGAPFLSQDIKPFKEGGKNCYRLRVGSIRILFKTSPHGVEIVDIDYRGNIY